MVTVTVCIVTVTVTVCIVVVTVTVCIVTVTVTVCIVTVTVTVCMVTVTVTVCMVTVTATVLVYEGQKALTDRCHPSFACLFSDGCAPVGPVPAKIRPDVQVTYPLPGAKLTVTVTVTVCPLRR